MTSRRNRYLTMNLGEAATAVVVAAAAAVKTIAMRKTMLLDWGSYARIGDGGSRREKVSTLSKS